MVAFEIFFACFLALLGLAASVLTTTYAGWVQANPWVAYVGWACLMVSFGFLVAAVLQWRSVHAKLMIHWARWHGDRREKSRDVADIVRGWISDNQIHHHVHQDELGDVPPHEAKKLEICFSLGSIKRKILVVKNDDDLIIPDDL